MWLREALDGAGILVAGRDARKCLLLARKPDRLQVKHQARPGSENGSLRGEASAKTGWAEAWLRIASDLETPGQMIACTATAGIAVGCPRQCATVLRPSAPERPQGRWVSLAQSQHCIWA